MSDPVPQYTFKINVHEGIVEYSGLDPMDVDMKTLINNAINLFAATSGQRTIPRASGIVSASNPRADQVKTALQRQNATINNGERE